MNCTGFFTSLSEKHHYDNCRMLYIEDNLKNLNMSNVFPPLVLIQMLKIPSHSISVISKWNITFCLAICKIR